MTLGLAKLTGRFTLKRIQSSTDVDVNAATSANIGVAASSPVDESLNADGSVRELWHYLLDGVQALGAEGLNERHSKARRILRDDGATYNVYTPEQSSTKSWELDLIPFLIGSDEWATIESGLLERAELFNLILNDLYGERELVKSGILPPEVIFSHSGFLRPCHGIRLEGEHQLILHAVDMVRRENGELCVFTDRSQSPSGAGYALENRTVMSRVLPSLFRDSHVHRLAHFFQRMRVKLSQLASNVDEPRVVILTPGALNETHFEHAYLANYLGYPLVQSGDLLVRNGFVWMKSLDGLARVDVILRRVDDWFCDPLELKSDSHLGVPGLLEVARQGRVAIANPLGSGVLENPVLLKFLPKISKRLLGRNLRIASVPTYWCGDKDDLAFVLANFSTLIIKPIFRGHGKSVYAGALTAEEQRLLIEQIKAQPQQFVAQERIAPTQAPTLVEGELKSRPVIWRSFAVASGPSYYVMPGGLTRVGLDNDSWIISNQLNATNKDTWVVASEPERPSETDAFSEKVEPSQQYTSLPSRVVENLFWFGRYAERAEATLRMLRTVFVLLNGADTLPTSCRNILLRAVTEVSDTFPGFSLNNEAMFENPEAELMAVILDHNRPGSVRSCLLAMMNCAEESKELLSSDTLRVINDIRDVLDNLDQVLQGGMASAPEEALDPLVTALMALAGLTQESMIRGVGYRFMKIGRRLERGIQTINLLRVTLIKAIGETDEKALLSSLFLVLEVLITYRRRYRARIDVARGLELILIDTSNPRSLLYQFEQLQEHIKFLPEVGVSSRELQSEQRALLEAVTTLRLNRLVDLASVDEDSGRREQFDQMLGRLHHLMTEVGIEVSNKYFDHRVGPQQLVRAVWEG